MKDLNKEYINLKDALEIVDDVITEYIDMADLEVEIDIAESIQAHIISALVSAPETVKLDLKNGLAHIPSNVLDGAKKVARSEIYKDVFNAMGNFAHELNEKRRNS